MMRPTTTRRATRRGNILIVTLSLLALMAVVGITAVYYTKDQAERARIQGLPSGGGEGFAADGTGPAMTFLSALIYDTNDYGPSLLNPVRGHSLTGTMYGRKPGAYVAWNGPGTFDGAPYNGASRRQLVNHRLFQAGNVTHPEYDNDYAPGTTYPATYGATHYAKNPPYTYPDIKDFYLASICPATGEVLVPSFVREAVFGNLAPGNPNWTNGVGRYLTARPTKDLHPNFPPVPPNADGTHTGDVQNLPGGFYSIAAGTAGVARNDSIWIDMGLPSFVLPNGKRIKPLVAPLILDLDGRLNLNAHGNVLTGMAPSGTFPAHLSGAGFGPWEISLEKALNADGTAIVNARGAATTRAGITSKAFYSRYAAAPNNEVPQYSQVPWTGFTGATPLQLPGATPASLFATSPTYSSGYSGNNAAIPNHPGLFNPEEWIGGGATKAFPHSDTGVMIRRYAPYPFDISKLSFAASATTSLVGTQVAPNPNPPARTTSNSYRIDPAHANRQLFTTISNSLHRTGLMPTSTVNPDPNAALGAIDLNRPLADYRTDTTTALSSTNAGNPTAVTDRQQFARDIFARLVAACLDPTTEASVTLATGAVTVAAAPNTAPYEKVRGIAQFAVNIVDYIDNDDVSTRFAWNTTTPTEVVYGVEKPRLVLNEVYAEVTNDAADQAFSDNTKMAGMAPTDKAHVRFWLELQNPSTAPYTAPTGGPLGDGSVAFGAKKPYKIEIVQNNKLGGMGVIGRLRIQTDPNYAANVTGEAGAAPDITFDFSPAGAMTIPPANGSATAGMVVCAANVPPTPTDATVSAAWLDYRYSPPGAPASPQLINGGAVGAANSLTYTVNLPTTADDISNTGTALGQQLSRHVVLLRRLANPYLDYDATLNPYITVDVLDHVRAADRVLLESGKMIAVKRTARAGAAPPGFEPNPQSIGKTQPYASFADPTVTSAATLVYPTTSMVLPQDPIPAVTTSARQTLGRQNSKSSTVPAAATSVPASDTLVAPYDWLVHMDRPLINQIELMHVSTGRPHELTTNFIGAGGTKYVGSAQTVMLASTIPQLYRALDLLTVQPYGHQTALGGRQSGKININTIQDRRVWRALFDAQTPTNYNTFDSAFVDTTWTNLMTTRTANMSNRVDTAGTSHPCPIPGATVHDGGGADRPFLPFGVATVMSGGTTFAGGTSLDDTLLRRNPPGTGVPHLAVVTGTHPYQQAEALRKILNNTTTVSHTFAVWITVGYFEVEGVETPSPVGGNFSTLGKEYYREAPGDTRKKYFAIVDRSNIGFKPEELTTPPAAGTPYTQVAQPFFTSVEENAPAGATLKVASGGGGSIYVNGIPVSLNGTIVVGTGANQEIVTATVTGDAAGVATLTVAPPLTKPHYAGESVSNIVPGNPGVPTDFDVNLPKYKAVVPLWVKLP